MGIFDQASVKSMRAHPSSNGSTNDSDHGVAEFIDDLVTLAELQVNLTVVDFKESARKAAVPLGLTLVSLTVIAASVPVVLFGLALLLAATLNIYQGWAMILAAAMAVALACPVVILCVARLRSGFNSFRTSREEFRRNLLWLRNVLVRAGTRITGAMYSKSMISSPSGTRCMLVHPNAFGAFRKPCRDFPSGGMSAHSQPHGVCAKQPGQPQPFRLLGLGERAGLRGRTLTAHTSSWIASRELRKLCSSRAPGRS